MPLLTPSLVQSGFSNTVALSGSATLTTTPVTVGNVIVVAAVIGTTTGASLASASVTDNLGNVYTRVATANITTSGVALFTAPVTVGGSCTVTLSGGITGTGLTVIPMEWTNVVSDTPFSLLQVASSTATTLAAQPMRVPLGSAAIITVGDTGDTGGSIAAASGMTTVHSNTTMGTGGHICEYRVAATAGGNYNVLSGINGNGTNLTFAAIILQGKDTRPTITGGPAQQTIVVGNTATFSVTAQSNGGTGLAYQWQKNGVNISGANSSSYTTPTVAAVDDGDAYRVIVTDSAGSAVSVIADLIVADINVADDASVVFSSWILKYKQKRTNATTLFHQQLNYGDFDTADELMWNHWYFPSAPNAVFNASVSASSSATADLTSSGLTNTPLNASISATSTAKALALNTSNIIVSASYVQTTTSGNTITFDTPANAQNGDLLVAFLFANNSAVSYSPPTGWTDIFDTLGRTITQKVVDGTEGSTLTFTASSSLTIGGFVVCLRRAAFDVTASYSNSALYSNANQLVTSSITTTSTDSLVFVWPQSNTGGVTFTPATTAITELVRDNDASSPSSALYFVQGLSVGSVPAYTIDYSPTASARSYTLSFIPAVPAGAALASSASCESTSVTNLTTQITLGGSAASVVSAVATTIQSDITLYGSITANTFIASSDLSTSITVFAVVSCTAATPPPDLSTQIKLATSITDTVNTVLASLNTGIPLTAGLTVQSTTSSDLATSIKLNGSIATLSSTSADVTIPKPLQASIYVQSTLSGTITGTSSSLEGTAAIVSSATATLSGTASSLESSASAVSTATATLAGTASSFDGLLNVVSSTSAALLTNIRLAASQQDTVNTVVASLNTGIPLTASIQVLSSGTASISTKTQFASSASVNSTVSGTLTGVSSSLSATVSIASTTSANLSTSIALSGQISSSAQATSSMTATTSFVSSVTSISAATASLTVGARFFANASDNTNTVLASLNTGIPLTAAVTCSTSVIGAITTSITVVSQLQVSASASANLTTAVKFASLAQSSASVQAVLTTLVNLNGDISVSSSVYGELTTAIRLNGYADIDANVSGSISTQALLTSAIAVSVNATAKLSDTYIDANIYTNVLIASINTLTPTNIPTTQITKQDVPVMTITLNEITTSQVIRADIPTTVITRIDTITTTIVKG